MNGLPTVRLEKLVKWWPEQKLKTWKAKPEQLSNKKLMSSPLPSDRGGGSEGWMH